MATEADLIARMRDDGGSSTRIDVTDVIRRSRRRRMVGQLAIGGTATLAVIGLGVGALSGLGAGGNSSVFSDAPASDSGGAGSGAEDAPAPGAPFSDGGPSIAQGDGATGGIAQAPANKINLCEGTLAEVAQSPIGLELTPVFPAAAASGSDVIEGAVVMTNVGGSRVVGTTGARPAITLSRDSTVLWHSNGFTTMIAVEVDLEPGESMEYPVTFEPVRCQVQDDTQESFRIDLPPVGAGTYELSAAIDFVPDSATAMVDNLVTGPRTSIVLE